MGSLFVEILGVLGSVASGIGLFVSARPVDYHYGLKDGLLLSLSLVLAVGVCVRRVRDYQKSRPIVLRSDHEIRQYMRDWISKGGRVLIFSHDLTWVSDEETKDLLRGKARRGELNLCLRAQIPFAEELSTLGATISTYADLGYIPTSRFTIVNYGRSDAHVAIGRRVGDDHVVREIPSGQDPIFALSNDLAEVVMKLAQISRTVRSSR